MTSRFESGKSMGFASGPVSKALVASLLFSVTGGCSPAEPVQYDTTPEHQEAPSPVPASRVVSELEERERMEAAAEPDGQEIGSGTIETSSGSVTIGADARIAVKESDTDLQVRTVDLSSEGPEGEPTCQLTHGEAVTVVAATHFENEDRYYLKVAGTNCQGWILENFVQP